MDLQVGEAAGRPAARLGGMRFLLNVTWLVLGGFWLALAIANIKMIPVSMVPLGKRIVDHRDLRPGMQPMVTVPDGR